jgi:hypothetical protein
MTEAYPLQWPVESRVGEGDDDPGPDRRTAFPALADRAENKEARRAHRSSTDGDKGAVDRAWLAASVAASDREIPSERTKGKRRKTVKSGHSRFK